ncbi:MAG TPA: hypothetical protein DDW27_17175 [Bacteroidales bacterium]|nr:hypothetical protein [Bacteroidales bacterium]
MKKLLILIFILLHGAEFLHAQGEIDQQQRVFFRNERSFGLSINSDGFGIGYREARRKNYLNKRILEFDLGLLKHPKEYKTSNPWAQNTGTFVFGKLNSVVYFRGGLGHQREIFSKEDAGGIAIRYFYSGGPVISLQKPIYYRVLYPVGGTLNEYQLKEEKFDIRVHDPTMIYSKAGLTKGINEIKALPGLYAKGGFNFEYSREDKVIHAIEIGAQINAFPKKIPIMDSQDNKAIFFSIFASYRFGVIVDPLHPEDSNISNLFRRKKVQ